MSSRDSNNAEKKMLLDKMDQLLRLAKSAPSHRSRREALFEARKTMLELSKIYDQQLGLVSVPEYIAKLARGRQTIGNA